MLVRWLAVWLAWTGLILADDVGLVRVGESWRYLPGLVEPPGPLGAWRLPGFDDSQWPLGRAGFSSGASSYNEATVLPDVGWRCVSAYFRKTFAVADPARVQWLVLRIDYSAGFVGYLNGREIVRRNVKGDPDTLLPREAVAVLAHPRGLPEEIDLSEFRDRLIAGSNVLAIHALTTGLGDWSFGLLPELLANFTRGPFIQNSSSNRVQIIWRTARPSDAVVEFGTSAALERRLANPAPATHHVLTLTNLASDTLYQYRVSSTAGGQTATAETRSFRTLKERGSLSFVLFGDSGAGSAEQYAIAEVIRRAEPDLVLHAGDVIYPSFTFPLADTRCLSVYAPHARTTPYFFAFGNHDLYSGDAAVLETFYLPTNSVTGTEHYYSFDHGDAHFAVLFVPYLNQYQLKPGDDQHRWLTADLAASQKPWKFLLFHNPMCTSGLHRFDDLNGNRVADRIDIRDVILPLAEKYGVQMALVGHDHSYERFNPTNGVYSITSGGGGVGLYPLTQLDEASAQFWSRHNCVKVTVNGETLTLQALDPTGAVFDSMTLGRSVSGTGFHRAGWHTPVIETKPADDGDGNVTGQNFDFRGPPIPTQAGLFSNLGQVYVNNDQTHLFVGIEQCMIYPNNNVFLFLESPRLKGVTNLVGVGNGRIDPDQEGADGLDFLSNLSFTNFAPVIGCILGDEFGDGTARSFARPGLPLNIGQGIFHLDGPISGLPGTRLQQFNRSPQTGPISGEQNANFIALAIPLQALGELRPGDTMRFKEVSLADAHRLWLARERTLAILREGLAQKFR